MKLAKMSIKKSIMAVAVAGMFAGTMACNAPSSNESQEVDPGTDEMYEEPMPTDDTTSAVDTTMTDTLDSGF